MRYLMSATATAIATVTLVAPAVRPPHATSSVGAASPDGETRLLGVGPVYTNHTVRNECTPAANMKSWQYKLEGVAESEVLQIYNEPTDPMLPWPGTAKTSGYSIGGVSGVQIWWLQRSGSTTVVAPLQQAHFGYVLDSGVSPSQVTGEWQSAGSPTTTCFVNAWTLANWATPPAASATPSASPSPTAATPIPTATETPVATPGVARLGERARAAAVPLSLSVPFDADRDGPRRSAGPLRAAQDDNPLSVDIRITNVYSETIVIERHAKVIYQRAIQLADLIMIEDKPNPVLDEAAQVDPAPYPLRPDESVTFTFQPIDGDAKAAVMYYFARTLRAFQEDPAAPPSYTAFEALGFVPYEKPSPPPPPPVFLPGLFRMYEVFLPRR